MNTLKKKSAPTAVTAETQEAKAPQTRLSYQNIGRGVKC